MKSPNGLLLATILFAACSGIDNGPEQTPVSTSAAGGESSVRFRQIVGPTDALSSSPVAPPHVWVLPGTGPVNIRQGPGVDFAVVGQLDEGIEVPVIAIAPSGDWIRLNFEGRNAWVYSPFIEIIGDLSSLSFAEEAVEPLASDIDLDRAAGVIEGFTGESAIQLEFLEEAAMPNAGLRPGWKLRDASGRLFWLDTATYSLVQVEPSTLFSAGTDDTKDILELRQIAEHLALEHSARFGELRANLDYSEGDKLAQFYFFQWEDRSEPWGMMPPMVQVGLATDGRLHSWLNTLDLTD